MLGSEGEARAGEIKGHYLQEIRRQGESRRQEQMRGQEPGCAPAPASQGAGHTTLLLAREPGDLRKMFRNYQI